MVNIKNFDYSKFNFINKEIKEILPPEREKIKLIKEATKKIVGSLPDETKGLFEKEIKTIEINSPHNLPPTFPIPSDAKESTCYYIKDKKHISLSPVIIVSNDPKRILERLTHEIGHGIFKDLEENGKIKKLIHDQIKTKRNNGKKYFELDLAHKEILANTFGINFNTIKNPTDIYYSDQAEDIYNECNEYRKIIDERLGEKKEKVLNNLTEETKKDGKNM